MNLEDLKRYIKMAIFDQMDHKNLDLDVAYFAERPSTVENITIFIWHELKKVMYLEGTDYLLYKVKVWEFFGNKFIGLYLAISFLTPDLNIGLSYEIFQIRRNEHVKMIAINFSSGNKFTRIEFFLILVVDAYFLHFRNQKTTRQDALMSCCRSLGERERKKTQFSLEIRKQLAKQNIDS